MVEDKEGLINLLEDEGVSEDTISLIEELYDKIDILEGRKEPEENDPEGLSEFLASREGPIKASVRIRDSSGHGIMHIGEKSFPVEGLEIIHERDVRPIYSSGSREPEYVGYGRRSRTIRSESSIEMSSSFGMTVEKSAGTSDCDFPRGGFRTPGGITTEFGDFDVIHAGKDTPPIDWIGAWESEASKAGKRMAEKMDKEIMEKFTDILGDSLPDFSDEEARARIAWARSVMDEERSK
jgi:hypothetical protein